MVRQAEARMPVLEKVKANLYAWLWSYFSLGPVGSFEKRGLLSSSDVRLKYDAGGAHLAIKSRVSFLTSPGSTPPDTAERFG